MLEMIRSEAKVDSILVIFLMGKDDRKSVEDFFEKRKYEQLHEMQK